MASNIFAVSSASAARRRSLEFLHQLGGALAEDVDAEELPLAGADDLCKPFGSPVDPCTFDPRPPVMTMIHHPGPGLALTHAVAAPAPRSGAHW
jgi:hypothetical protein